MIHFITAITPEANAVKEYFSMTRLAGPDIPDSLSIFHNKENTVFLLVTGSGKTAAACAVTEYLAFLARTDFLFRNDIFCNLGICGTDSTKLLGQGFLCAAVCEESTEKTLYPELYTHPFAEAFLATCDCPVTTTPGLAPASDHAPATVIAGNTMLRSFAFGSKLPILFDMEGYAVLYALYRKVRPSRCFAYKVVSDACNGRFPSAEEITALLSEHLPALTEYLQHGALIKTANTTTTGFTENEEKRLSTLFPFSATMEHRLSHLLTYADLAGIDISAAADAKIAELDLTKNPSAKGFTKKEAGAFLEFLEQFVLTPEIVSTTVQQNSGNRQPDSLAANHLTHGIPTPVTARKTLRLFRHIYVETEVLTSPVTKKILNRFPEASVIPIRHYKDIFNRSRQDLTAQETEPSFILAANHGAKYYPGAPVCQSFGEEHFYYTSCIMNCIYDCDYCYLQGMYPTGNIVVFVNTEDYFCELNNLLKEHPVYLCCSYDSDLTALNGLFPHAEEFCRFAAKHPTLRLELRTKCASLPFIDKLTPAKNIVMAFTVSPQEIIDRYEHFTTSLHARLKAAKHAAELGFSVRLCIDPVLDVPNAQTLYRAMVDTLFTVLSPDDITDLSLGVFRISKDYLKQLRIAKPACAFSHYPYTVTDGVCHYDESRADLLLTSVTDALTAHGISQEKLFFWKPETE